MEGKAIDYLINEQIRDKEVRVIGAEGNQLGVMSIQDARAAADEAGLDLVRVSPNAKPPVCKIIDYGKFRYEISRKEKEAKKKQKTVEIKEVRLSPNIEENDLNTKINQATYGMFDGADSGLRGHHTSGHFPELLLPLPLSPQ